ncbi:helix-turn-helix domain-containing protein [Nocardia sp. ET3-3]|uniref:Helix-turn-helix domain-containing protein n=2 Tax=Nocardia terrae TaxID=2675851 RepID=A0A7K1V9Z3_9NOCA|nr:helix-turn-helix domain-containing protein [Nocardia terrae]
MPTTMTPAKAAEIAGCHLNSIYAALLSGELKGYQRRAPRGRWRIFPEDLTRWIRGEAPA